MKKVLRSFTFLLGIISLLIIALNYIGYDNINIILIMLNPILDKIIYLEPFRTWLFEGTVIRYALSGKPFVTSNIYLAHFLTFLFYGLIFDLIKYGVRKLSN